MKNLNRIDDAFSNLKTKPDIPVVGHQETNKNQRWMKMPRRKMGLAKRKEKIRGSQIHFEDETRKGKRPKPSFGPWAQQGFALMG